MRRWRLALALAALTVLPAAARGQSEGPVRHVGVLISFKRPKVLEADRKYGPFLQRLKELGYVEGKNLVIDWRFGEGDSSKLPQMAADLVRLKVDVIVAAGSDGIAAAQAATPTIPIVLYGGTDVVAQGFVQSLAHPGGHTTGVTWLLRDSLGKQIEFLAALSPGLSRLAVLTDPTNPGTPIAIEQIKGIAGRLNITSMFLGAKSDSELETAIADASRQRAQAMFIVSNNFFNERYPRVAELALKYRLPSGAGIPYFADEGGLMGYGVDSGALWRRAADYVDRILKGAAPGDIPVEQPSKLYLTINRRTAKALGLTIPPELLVQADKVIE